MKRIKIAYAEGVDYKTELRKYLVAYRNTPHSITGKCPSEMLFGRKVRTRVPFLADIHNDDFECRDKDAEMKHSMVESRNVGKQIHTTSVGDLVLLKRDNPTKTQTPFHVNPYVVREVNGPMLVLESSSGQIYRHNIHHTRPYYCPSTFIAGSRQQTPESGRDLQERTATHQRILGPQLQEDTEAYTSYDTAQRRQGSAVQVQSIIRVNKTARLYK